MSCHLDDFNKTTDPSHTLAGFSVSCESCHSTMITDWKAPNFVHGEAFPLTAGHSGLRCVSCHANTAFTSTETACITCHRDDYISVESPNHQANGYPEDCLECHTTSNWDTPFDHQTTQFPLSGRHPRQIASCHSSGQFAGLDGHCWSCHAADYETTNTPDHQEIQLPHQCEGCHTAQNWDASFGQ
ncbi:MAG: hypothetical protein IPP40_04605 [bacterium]|nr:hypothetical protein [bacterium]